MSNTYTFSARSYEWRLHCAEGAIRDRLKEEVTRAGAKRAFVICSRSITSKTNAIDDIQAALGDLYAGVFDGIEIDSSYRSVVAGTEAAREAGADLLIGVGGGSVIVATRGVDVFFCEQGDHFELMTQYPEGRPAVSPRLDAPKLPIINIPTTPTSAMNRGGSGLANPDLDHRMEYFDPKTRPMSLIWDWGLIAATPADLMRSTATHTFSGAVMESAVGNLNPLVEGNRRQILRLAKRAYYQLMEEPDALGPRLDLFAAALLENRTSDDAVRGTHVHEGEAFDDDYALSTAIHVRYPHVRQGEVNAALQPTVVRLSGTPPLEGARRVAEALDVWREGMTADEAKDAVADGLEEIYRRAGMPVRLRDLDFPREDFPTIAHDSCKVFNANAGVRDEAQQIEYALRVLETAW